MLIKVKKTETFWINRR